MKLAPLHPPVNGQHRPISSSSHIPCSMAVRSASRIGRNSSAPGTSNQSRFSGIPLEARTFRAAKSGMCSRTNRLLTLASSAHNENSFRSTDTRRIARQALWQNKGLDFHNNVLSKNKGVLLATPCSIQALDQSTRGSLDAVIKRQHTSHHQQSANLWGLELIIAPNKTLPEISEQVHRQLHSTGNNPGEIKPEDSAVLPAHLKENLAEVDVITMAVAQYIEEVNPSTNQTPAEELTFINLNDIVENIFQVGTQNSTPGNLLRLTSKLYQHIRRCDQSANPNTEICEHSRHQTASIQLFLQAHLEHITDMLMHDTTAPSLQNAILGLPLYDKDRPLDRELAVHRNNMRSRLHQFMVQHCIQQVATPLKKEDQLMPPALHAKLKKDDIVAPQQERKNALMALMSDPEIKAINTLTLALSRLTVSELNALAARQSTQSSDLFANPTKTFQAKNTLDAPLRQFHRTESLQRAAQIMENSPHFEKVKDDFALQKTIDIWLNLHTLGLTETEFEFEQAELFRKFLSDG